MKAAAAFILGAHKIYSVRHPLSPDVLLFYVKSSSYQLGCTVAAVSAQWPNAEHAKHALQNTTTEWTPHMVGFSFILCIGSGTQYRRTQYRTCTANECNGGSRAFYVLNNCRNCGREAFAAYFCSLHFDTSSILPQRVTLFPRFDRDIANSFLSIHGRRRRGDGREESNACRAINSGRSLIHQ